MLPALRFGKYQHVRRLLQRAERICRAQDRLVDGRVRLHLAVHDERRDRAAAGSRTASRHLLGVRVAHRSEVREREHRDARLDPERRARCAPPRSAICASCSAVGSMLTVVSAQKTTCFSKTSMYMPLTSPARRMRADRPRARAASSPDSACSRPTSSASASPRATMHDAEVVAVVTAGAAPRRATVPFAGVAARGSARTRRARGDVGGILDRDLRRARCAFRRAMSRIVVLVAEQHRLARCRRRRGCCAARMIFGSSPSGNTTRFGIAHARG